MIPAGMTNASVLAAEADTVAGRVKRAVEALNAALTECPAAGVRVAIEEVRIGSIGAGVELLHIDVRLEQVRRL